MKSYKEMTASVLKRRDEYIKAKKRRRMYLIKTASSVMGTAAAAFIGLMIYNSSILQDIKPEIYNSRYNATESVATSPAHPAQTEKEEIVTTEIRQTDSEHSHTQTEKPTYTTTAPEETKSSTVKKTSSVTETSRAALATETKKTSPVTETRRTAPATETKKTSPATETNRTATATETKITALKTTSVKTETKPAVQTQSAPTTEFIYTVLTTAKTYATSEICGEGTGALPMESGPPGASPIETNIATAVATTPFLTENATSTTTTAVTTVTVTTDSSAETNFPNTETTTTPVPEATFPIEADTLFTSEIIYYDKSYLLSPPE